MQHKRMLATILLLVAVCAVYSIFAFLSQNYVSTLDIRSSVMDGNLHNVAEEEVRSVETAPPQDAKSTPPHQPPAQQPPAQAKPAERPPAQVKPVGVSAPAGSFVYPRNPRFLNLVHQLVTTSRNPSQSEVDYLTSTMMQYLGFDINPSAEINAFETVKVGERVKEGGAVTFGEPAPVTHGVSPNHQLLSKHLRLFTERADGSQCASDDFGHALSRRWKGREEAACEGTVGQRRSGAYVAQIRQARHAGDDFYLRYENVGLRMSSSREFSINVGCKPGPNMMRGNRGAPRFSKIRELMETIQSTKNEAETISQRLQGNDKWDDMPTILTSRDCNAPNYNVFHCAADVVNVLIVSDIHQLPIGQRLRIIVRDKAPKGRYWAMFLAMAGAQGEVLTISEAAKKYGRGSSHAASADGVLYLQNLYVGLPPGSSFIWKDGWNSSPCPWTSVIMRQMTATARAVYTPNLAPLPAKLPLRQRKDGGLWSSAVRGVKVAPGSEEAYFCGERTSGGGFQAPLSVPHFLRCMLWLNHQWGGYEGSGKPSSDWIRDLRVLLYASRPQRSYRAMTNEAAVLTQVRETFKGAMIIALDMGSYAWSQQVTLASMADVMFGMHGANLAHCMYSTNPELLSLVEIFTDQKDRPRMYENLMSWSGGGNYIPLVNEAKRRVISRKLTADVQWVLDGIRRALEG